MIVNAQEMSKNHSGHVVVLSMVCVVKLGTTDEAYAGWSLEFRWPIDGRRSRSQIVDRIEWVRITVFL